MNPAPIWKSFETQRTPLQIARYDDAGNYRPLKTAPNLRHGWRLELVDVSALRLALDLFYPGRLAAFLAAGNGNLASTPFRETLSTAKRDVSRRRENI